MTITFEMDLDQRLIERSMFTVLDLLSDIGGLASIVASMGVSIVNYFNSDGLANTFLASRLYEMSHSIIHGGFFERRRRRLDIRRRFMERLSEETDIVTLVRKIRTMQVGLGRMIPAGEFIRLEKKCAKEKI